MSNEHQASRAEHQGAAPKSEPTTCVVCLMGSAGGKYGKYCSSGCGRSYQAGYLEGYKAGKEAS